MARICVLGLGYVGLVTAACFARHGHSVIGVDKDKDKLELVTRGIPPFYEPGLGELLNESRVQEGLSFTGDIIRAVETSDIIFICVGTPTGEKGRADMSQVEDAARSVCAGLNDYKLIVQKSTVPVGTAEKIKRTIKLAGGEKCSLFDVASNPEFLREGSAVNDFMYPDRIVIGVESARAEKKLLDLYRDFNCPVLVTGITTAEMIKYASNAFLATKISYINLVADICEKVGADVKQVAAGMGYDKRIGREFLNAGAGYGGSCLSKDIKAFAATAELLGVDATLFRVVESINQERVRGILKKLEHVLWVYENKTIAVLGLAFKSNTEDVRDSPGIKLINQLVKKGCRVNCYDPKAMANARKEFHDPAGVITPARDAYAAAVDADALVLMTEWPEFIALDFAKIKRLMRTPVIIDGRNILPGEQLRKQGFLYYGIGI